MGEAEGNSLLLPEGKGMLPVPVGHPPLGKAVVVGKLLPVPIVTVEIGPAEETMTVETGSVTVGNTVLVLGSSS